MGRGPYSGTAKARFYRNALSVVLELVPGCAVPGRELTVWHCGSRACFLVELRDFGHCGTLEVRRDAQAAVPGSERSLGPLTGKHPRDARCLISG